MILKSLIGVIIALTLACAGLGLQLYKAKADVRTAEAAQRVAEGERDLAVTRASDAAAGAAGWKTVAGERKGLLEACQVENTRVREVNAAAVAAALARARDAETAFKSFVDRYAANLRNPDCVAARQRLDQFCAALDY